MIPDICILECKSVGEGERICRPQREPGGNGIQETDDRICRPQRGPRRKQVREIGDGEWERIGGHYRVPQGKGVWWETVDGEGGM